MTTERTCPTCPATCPARRTGMCRTCPPPLRGRHVQRHVHGGKIPSKARGTFGDRLSGPGPRNGGAVRSGRGTFLNETGLHLTHPRSSSPPESTSAFSKRIHREKQREHSANAPRLTPEQSGARHDKSDHRRCQWM